MNTPEKMNWSTPRERSSKDAPTPDTLADGVEWIASAFFGMIAGCFTHYTFGWHTSISTLLGVVIIIAVRIGLKSLAKKYF